MLTPIALKKKARGVIRILKDLKYDKMPDTAPQSIHVVVETIHQEPSFTNITLDQLEHRPSFSEEVTFGGDILKQKHEKQGLWEDRVSAERFEDLERNIKAKYDNNSELLIRSFNNSIESLNSTVDEVKKWIRDENEIETFLQNECSKSNDNDTDDDDDENFDEEKAVYYHKKISTWLNDTTRKGFSLKIRNEYKKDFNYESEEYWFEEGIDRVFDPYYYEFEQDEIESKDGRITKSGDVIGRGSYTLKNGDEICGLWKSGIRHGFGSSNGLNLESHGVKTVSGIYKDGVLHGDGSAKLRDGTVLEGSYNNCCMEGPVLGRPGEHGGSSFIGQYVAGLPSNYVWKKLEGGGWLHGKVDKRGKLTGENIMYIYPDLYTLLVGTFEDGVMISAREAYVKEVAMLDDILYVVPGKCRGSVFSYSPATNREIKVNWKQMDPLEKRCVVCRESTINNAGIGLFAKRKLPAGSFASFYHGMHFKHNEHSPDKTYNYQIFLDWKSAPFSDFLDLPPEAWSDKNYCASLGHKINHKFHPNCEYVKFEHPRFGKSALGIRTVMDIEEGEELCANYKYDIADAPDWYADIYADKDAVYYKL